MIPLPTLTSDHYSQINSTTDYEPQTPQTRRTQTNPVNSSKPVTPQSTSDLVQLHASSSIASPFPDTSHQKKAQGKHHADTAAKKQQIEQDARKRKSDSSDDQDDIASPRKSPSEELKEINANIRRITNKLRRAQKDERKEKAARNLEKDLNALTREKRRLEKEIAASTGQSHKVSSNEKIYESGIVSGVNTKDQFEAPDALETIRNMLDEREQDLAALSKTIKGLIYSPNSQNIISERMAEMREIQEEIKTLKNMLKYYGADAAPQPVAKPEGSSSTARPSPPQAGGSKPAKNLTLLELIRTKTTHRPVPAKISPNPASENGSKAGLADSSEVVSEASSEVVSEPSSEVVGENSSDESIKDSDSYPSDLHSVHENARNSTLIMPEDLKQRLSMQARKTVDKIDFGIEKAANEADQMGLLVVSLNAQLNRMRKDGQSTASEIEKTEQMLVDYKKKQRKCFKKVGKLTEARDKLEEKELPEIPRLTRKEKEEAYKALLESVKSPQTRGLEKIHADMLAELERTTSASPFWTATNTLLAGAAGFSVSFLFPNTLSRFVPAPLIPISWVFAPIVAGGLHVITATPMVKQVMTRAWTSNAMAELNNHFLLRTSQFLDWRRGELDKPKYASKDPLKTEKISITERLNEEKPFRRLYDDRFNTEEIGYYSYTMNYILKAILAASISTYLAGGTWETKGVEATMHGVLGALSGAEYLWIQQRQRSKHPEAKQTAVPTMKCYAAEAAALQSLRDDLLEKIEQCRIQINKDPGDKTESNLNKALRRTDKALIIANLRSKNFGIFRHEWRRQFSREVWRDTLSEALGRIISLLPTDLVGELTRSWRASPDPLLMFLGHTLPAVALIESPGFTARPLYSGVIRALLKAFETDRESKTVVTRAPDMKTVAEDDPELGTISSSASQRSSEEHASESVIVGQASEEDDSDEERWEGNPTERDLHQGL